MKIQITGRQLRLTKAIHDYVEEKVSKAQKYFNHIVWAEVFVKVEKTTHEVEIVIHASKQTFRALAKEESVYAAVDIASDKIDAQLRKYKERLKEGRKHVPETPEAMLDESKPSSVRFSVVKQVPLSPMTPDAAALEMERLGYTFWMFHNQETRKVNVIFRRLDDSFGLLQPVRKESH
ncbi:MAG: ribosomal subunit interface protein [Elusimicrobia bacterium GWA2_69_24]|nr:MAG: ribosomal subunit interface protein [Elusimicrobia bacterium GWA2_69_24]HBL17686.1 ribosome-associated translation inhibitor RaiA [Elusimicrobiota bacterium]